MKTIGILGGMSPESTVTYYKTLNGLMKQRLGGHASAKLLIHSVNFAETHAAQLAGDWDGIGADLAGAAVGLERAGADVILLATNTMHTCAAAIEAAVTVPFLHIADACGARLKADGHARPALLGTAYTMEQAFYTGRIAEHFGMDVKVPSKADRADIHRIIFDELVNGTAAAGSRAIYIEITETLKAGGADSVILGCTEIGMLLDETNSPLPVYDTALIHCEAAADFALA